MHIKYFFVLVKLPNQILRITFIITNKAFFNNHEDKFYFVIFFSSVIAVRKKAPQLTVVPVQTTNIPPKEIVVYTKQTQTTATGHELRDGKF